ncbi:hypothetical protein SAMN05660831_02071 [Thiohalospira halophila DSM 15071]|uniref:Uncharacterized protein n=1 Tax=Thiohalospira halophila DSM 15071 TaxID=1123397 RepID=A0A1I1U9A5_9GAMM|nr:hypothetical protein [Thiohalospira halophila]SFD67264.1 hypothetical protein SAMN05660831_02071 [Thiohalospira halophila DSM 15071]
MSASIAEALKTIRDRSPEGGITVAALSNEMGNSLDQVAFVVRALWRHGRIHRDARTGRFLFGEKPERARLVGTLHDWRNFVAGAEVAA